MTLFAASQLIERLAEAAGDFLMGQFRKETRLTRLRASAKEAVTAYDKMADDVIVRGIKKAYPEHALLTEESGYVSGDPDWLWIVDSLDGTGNFAHRYPCFCTSIALTLEDEPIVGVAYDPIREHLFSAAVGGGAILNGEPLCVSRTERLIDAFIGMDWTRDAASREQNAQILARLMPHCSGMRVCGSAVLGICYVAAGWWDAYWHLGPQPWDTAAGTLIVHEAGGQVTDLAGNLYRLGTGSYLASNGRLHDRICAKID